MYIYIYIYIYREREREREKEKEREREREKENEREGAPVSVVRLAAIMAAFSWKQPTDLQSWETTTTTTTTTYQPQCDLQCLPAVSKRKVLLFRCYHSCWWFVADKLTVSFESFPVIDRYIGGHSEEETVLLPCKKQNPLCRTNNKQQTIANHGLEREWETKNNDTALFNGGSVLLCTLGQIAQKGPDRRRCSTIRVSSSAVVVVVETPQQLD